MGYTIEYDAEDPTIANVRSDLGESTDWIDIPDTGLALLKLTSGPILISFRDGPEQLASDTVYTLTAMATRTETVEAEIDDEEEEEEEEADETGEDEEAEEAEEEADEIEEDEGDDDAEESEEEE